MTSASLPPPPHAIHHHCAGPPSPPPPPTRNPTPPSYYRLPSRATDEHPRWTNKSRANAMLSPPPHDMMEGQKVQYQYISLWLH
jgi:hypothetical protein